MMTMANLKYCLTCSERFRPTGARQLYCSPRCRIRYKQIPQRAKLAKEPLREQIVTTKEQRRYAKLLLQNNGLTQAQAYAIAFNKDIDAPDIVQKASLAKKSEGVKTLLADAKPFVEETLINTVKEWGDHEKPRQREIALNAAMYIHDKVEGKATQKIEQTVQMVRFSIDLSGGSAGGNDD